MAWTAQQMAEKRAKLQKTSAVAGGSPSQSAQSAASSPKVGAKSGTGTAAAGGNETWTADKMAAKRAALQTRAFGSAGSGASLLEQAYDDYRLGNNLGFAEEQGGSLGGSGLTLSAASGGSSLKGGAKSGLYANAAQKLKNSYADYSQLDAFDKANQWFDQPRNQELVRKMTETKGTDGYTSYAQMGTSVGGSADPFQKGNVVKKYSTADLEKMGYSADEIAQARNYLDTMESIPEWKQATRRTANTIGGIADTVAAAPLLGAEYLGQAVKNIRQSSVNRKALAEEVAANPREKNLYDRLMETDMDYQPKYSTGDLLQQGFTRQEIEDMRSRIAGTEASEGIDPEKSVGYQLYNRGQQLTGAAQSGQTDVQKAAQGVVTSAAENLAVAAVNPAAVLPVLSAQGAAESMGKAAEQGDSAGKALAGGGLKFGAGWAINSVGVADLAKTMGSDYAKDTLAGKLADAVRGLAGSAELTQKYPAIANAISGGVDNAMQAFVETYADKAIDAALGDSEAADTLLKKETFLEALESGLSGGASGALGGAVGTGLARMRGNTAFAEPEAVIAEQTAVNDDPAVHTPAQNASIAEYKDSVDPKMKEYVDRVRAGEQLEPYVVAQTSDRMRSAMMELTGLEKVGDRTLMDANAVQHITNRHAGGDGSADATMKNSADVARAAYVLNNFDNAYLAKDRAEGYMTRNGKRAPIVIFEKKIDGSHIVVEAACDTKKNTNYIISEYLAKNGVDTTEVTKGLRSPVSATSDPEVYVRNVVADPSATAEELQSSMDAASSPRDTSETLADLPSADTSIAPEGASVNGQAVENPGENVENALSVASAGAAEAELKETYGMRGTQSREMQQSGTAETLRSWGVSETAAKEIGLKLPEGTNTDRYAAAASTLYRLGQMEDVKSFDQALELAGSGSGMAANVNYVLGSTTGRNALEIAYTYGKGEAESHWEKSQLGGSLTEQSLMGRGETRYEGTIRNENEAASRVIELNAAATGTTAVLRNVLQNEAGQADSRVRAYLDSETGQIFFGDSATDAFGTALHEDWHWYNALDAEGGKQLMDHALTYLAQKDGFETIDEMIRNKMSDYANQGLTYEEAAEELVGDAWRGIFSTEEDFKRWVEFQRGQAEKNSGKTGAIHKVMNRVKEMLDGIVSRAKEILSADPENAAARRARKLAEKERRILQDEYFAHAEKAMDNLRAAKENAAALKNESAAEGRGMRFQLHEGKESLADQMNDHLERLEAMKPVAEISGSEVAFGASRNENIDNVAKYFDSIGNRVNREDFGTVELTRKGARTTVQHGNSRAKQAAIAAVPEVIRKGEQIGHETNWQGRGYDTYVFAAPIMMNGTKLVEGVIVNEYTRNNGRKVFYVHEVCWSDGSYVTLQDDGAITKKEDIPTQLPKAVRSSLAETQEISSEKSIAQNNGDGKGNGVPVKKNIRFQLGSPVEVDTQKDLVAVHNLTEENLKEALELGGMPSPSIAVVKANEGHTKYGPISLVFGPESVDPMVSRANRIYGSDAWTPTRPEVEYHINDKAAERFENMVSKASENVFDGKFRSYSSLRNYTSDDTSTLSRTELAQKLSGNTAVKLAYLAEKGVQVEPEYRAVQQEYDSAGRDTLEKLVELAGADNIRNVIESGDFNALDILADTAADALTETKTHGKLHGQNLRWEKRIEKLRTENRGRLYQMVENTYKMLTDTGSGETELDVEGTRTQIEQAAPAKDVENWVYEKLDGVIGQKGIRNGQDRFTPSGNQRSFAQLHNSYTLENLVQAMNSQQAARGQGVFGASASALMSTATAEYRNLDEVRADKGRLRQMPEEEYKALLEKADAQMDEVIDRLRRETTAHADNSFEEREILGTVLMQAAQGKRTAAAIGKAFAKEGYTIGKDTAQMILKLYKDVAAIPTGYFEAKPQRAVGFDEVRVAILPDNASRSLIESLKEKGVDVELYKAGDDANRTEVLNRVPDVRFQKAEQADRESRKNVQRQASRAIADNSAALETLGQMMGIARGVRISQDSIDGLALRWTKTTGSKTDRAKLAGETRALVEYLKADGADMAKAQSLAETLAGEVLDGATYRNTELWDQYPEYHDLSYTVNKDGPAKAELVKRYGTWSEAVAEARRHGVKLRQAEGVRDGNPAEQYESIVNDTRAVGGTGNGAAALFRSAAKQAGVDGAASMESTEWLDILMNVRDAIKPKVMSRFADAAEYEDAKVELAGRMIGDILNTDEMSDAQAIFDSFQTWQRNTVAAAVGEENVDAALKDLRKVQKEQKKEFDRRLYQNKREQSVQSYAEATGETDATVLKTVGDVNERLTFLREEYERQLKAETQRLKLERQRMLDDITLKFAEKERQLNIENDLLAHEYAKERQRADYAERQLIFQQDEIADWEAENQRKAAEWEQLQKERDEKAEALWKEYTEKAENALTDRAAKNAKAEALAKERERIAREGRQKDELKRAIRNHAAQLNQMVLRPAKDKYVQPRLILRAAEVAKLADMTLLNQNAVNRLDALANSIRAEYGDDSHPVVTEMSEDWKQSSIANLIDALKADLTASKEAQLDRLRKQLTEAEALEDSEKARALQDRLKARIKDVEGKPYLPMTADQLRMLKAITTSTLHVIRTANKTLSLQQAEAVDKIAGEAAVEVNRSKGNDGKFRKMLTRYNLDMLGGTRVFRMLGGYAKNSQMERLGTMLNDGQRRQTEILVEGTHLFDNVTGETNLKQMEKFAGKGAELVDLGLKDSQGRAAPLNHAQMCSLLMHLRNADSRGGAGSRHHGGSGTLCEEPLAKAAGSAESGDRRAWGCTAGIPSAGNAAG